MLKGIEKNLQQNYSHIINNKRKDQLKTKEDVPVIAFNLNENELIDLIEKRSNIYSKALHEIKCDKLSKNEIVKKVVKNYEAN